MGALATKVKLISKRQLASRRDYLAMNLHDRDITKRARQEGIELGTQQKAEDAARAFFANGASIELIAKSLSMSEEEVRGLTKDISLVNS